ncbi:hypothetical protein ACH4KN_17230 [Streptomyces sp. NPDC017546]|uniref:hypothetical protein n=1 Tax=Streptomyces sp. NPDC017546 TaxID=3365001 RepID=UPI0037A08B02
MPTRPGNSTPRSLVQVVHHQQDSEVERIGFFFEATRWFGDPVYKEPSKCLALEWLSAHDLPDLIEYPKQGLLGHLAADNSTLTEHGWV